MRTLEGIIIYCLKELGLNSYRKDSLPGVWVDDDKICAMGVRLSRWVTMHGFALNLNPDMKYFDGMIPCGIFDHGITSLNEQNIEIQMEELIKCIVHAFSMLFEKNYHEV